MSDSSKQELAQSSAPVGLDSTIQCPQCEQSFDSYSGLLRHQLNEHITSTPLSQPRRYDSESAGAPEPVASISSLVSRCFRDFQILIDALSTHDDHSRSRSRIQEELGRLRVWAGNFGAYRKQSDRLSLDHRLREAPELHHGVRNHLNDLSETIEEANAALSTSGKTSGDENALDLDGSDPDTSDSDGFWEQIRAENPNQSPFEEYTKDVCHTVTSLYKLSVSLQNPARRDRTVQASRIDLHHFEFYDIQHTSDLFNLAPDTELAQRLGKANTKRRQLLAYYKDHSERISKYVDVALNKAVSAPADPGKSETQSAYQQRPPTISTKWTQDTTASTIHQDIEIASDSGRTRFSATTSTAGDQERDSIPPPPGGSSSTKRDHFICPYCRQTIQLEKYEDWIYHTHSDLRPYICTFGGCFRADQLYDSFTEWSAHERQFHRREFFCSLCTYTFGEASSLASHLQNCHPDLSEDQQQEMAKQSTPTTSAQKCPLCIKSPISNPSRFQQHLARHLRRLARFVLPRTQSDDENSEARDEESGESRQALIMDDERKETLESVSANSRASVAEGSTSSLHSPTNDRLLDAIPEVTKDASEDAAKQTEGVATTEPINQSPEELRKLEIEATAALADRQETLGPEHPDTILCMDQVANIYWQQWRYRDVEIFLDPVVEMKKRLLGPEHDSTLGSMELKARALYEQRRYTQAEEIQAFILQVREKTLGPEHRLTLDLMHHMAFTRQQMGKLDESESLRIRVMETRKRVLGEDDPDTLWSIYSVGNNHLFKGNYEEGEKLLLQVVNASEKYGPAPRLWAIYAAGALSGGYRRLGELEKSEKYLTIALDGIKVRGIPDDQPIRLWTLGDLADLYFFQSRLGEAEDIYKDVLERTGRVFGLLNGERLYYKYQLARVLWEQSRFLEAMEMMEECVREMLETMGPDNQRTLRAVEALKGWRMTEEGTVTGKT
ncbi:uncharacterized protein N7482_006827 [Penicillium canariense]|uniref:C2H2-type domain-containing protein n=1 Tax=Penicillium canariense TaxID=189055 RepID=A0A9W9HXW4_9EURO|nr:uncharacterized protein N7482_006827 [Penicillium canariense]KAJ5159823.1 hypothetical protein N7482_006827 [Penicillium canariense]